MKLPQEKFWHTLTFKTGLIILFLACLVAGVLAGELTLIRIESATL
jgi:hypothetical protein